MIDSFKQVQKIRFFVGKHKKLWHKNFFWRVGQASVPGEYISDYFHKITLLNVKHLNSYNQPKSSKAIPFIQ